MTKREVTERPAGFANRNKSEVGNETRADVKGVQMGGSRAEAKGSQLHDGLAGSGTKGDLGGAVRELHKQHPERHDDLGPHHGGTAHLRHEPGKY